MVKTVLITGASSGIGKATARYFLQKGWNVAATMRSPQKHQDWAGENQLIYPILDVTAPTTIRSAITETLAKFGRIDVLVNNAGYGLTGPLESLSMEQLRRQYDTNVFGLIAVIGLNLTTGNLKDIV